MNKNLVIVLGLIVFVGVGYGVYFFFTRDDFGPTNLPTPEERARMKEIEQTSAQVAPDAKPGIGVRPPGSIPKAPVSTSTEEATSTDAILEDERTMLSEENEVEIIEME